MKYSIVTFGCRVNQADSQRLEAGLLARGAEPASSDTADLVIVNSCSVTASADQGVRQIVRRLARANPAVRIVVTGCYATRRPGEVAALPNLLRVVPNDHKDGLAADLAGALGLTTAAHFGEGEGSCGARIQPGVAGRTAYTLRVQTGCDEGCAYCIIPATRGRSRSVPLAQVLDEVDQAEAAGFAEIALTGVHLGGYGRDLSPATSLLALLTALDARPGGLRFRVSSLEPMDCVPAIVDLVSAGDRFHPHFHLPLQHASDRMLSAMRRPYTLDAYRRTVDRVRERLPHAAIGSDLIVGFPGETDEDFAASERYLPASPLTHLHVFPYSHRPGTLAASRPGAVPGAAVRDRARRLREIGAGLASRFRRAHLGTVRPGLTLEDGTLVVTDNYLKVLIGEGLTRNVPVRVRIDEVEPVIRGCVV